MKIVTLTRTSITKHTSTIKVILSLLFFNNDSYPRDIMMKLQVKKVFFSSPILHGSFSLSIGKCNVNKNVFCSPQYNFVIMEHSLLDYLNI
jgi:hypothetical protein